MEETERNCAGNLIEEVCCDWQGEYVKEILVAGAMALFLTAQQTGQQQQIPDAPKPQTTGIGPVAPGKGTTPTNNGETVPAAATLPDGPGASLPATPESQMPADTRDQPGQEAAPEVGAAPFTLRLQANFVEIPFSVKDKKGHPVPGIDWREVRVYENGLRQHMTNFVADPFPLSVALVIDQSMPVDVMSRVNLALGALQGAFAPYDEVALFTYNNGPKMQTDFTGSQSPRLTAVVERAKAVGREPMYYAAGEGLGGGININGGAQQNITPLTTGGGVGSPQGVNQVPREVHTLNDAILEAAKATTRAGKGRRRIVYVISDGKEYGSTAKTKDVIKYLQTNKIQVYGTLVGDSSVAGMGFLDHIHIPLMMRDNILPQYTSATGGETYAEFRTKGISESFAKITEEVRTQYTVGYYSKEPLIDGKFRKTEVRVLRPGLTVIAKDGYYPTAAAAPARKMTPPSATP